jgi:hypothetical protein
MSDFTTVVKYYKISWPDQEDKEIKSIQYGYKEIIISLFIRI